MRNHKESILQQHFVKCLKAYNLPEPIIEYRFNPQRKWRFDYAFPEHKIAIEIEGGIWVYGRHNRGIGMINDMEKYNWATINGWKVLRYTPQLLKNSINDIQQLICIK